MDAAAIDECIEGAAAGRALAEERARRAAWTQPCANALLFKPNRWSGRISPLSVEPK
jgi:hypothetical protein